LLIYIPDVSVRLEDKSSCKGRAKAEPSEPEAPCFARTQPDNQQGLHDEKVGPLNDFGYLLDNIKNIKKRGLIVKK
jgi:hypothetical protein